MTETLHAQAAAAGLSPADHRPHLEGVLMSTTAHAEAVAAGLTPAERARYVAYVALCQSQGREPITALDAAAQCRKVRNAPAEAPNLDASVTNGAKHTRNHPADSDAAGGDF